MKISKIVKEGDAIRTYMKSGPDVCLGLCKLCLTGQGERLEITETVKQQIFDHVAIVGTQDSLRPEVIQVVKNCRTASIVVRMITGNFIATARVIAKECGILDAESKGEIVMEDQEFAELGKLKMLENVLHLALCLIHIQWISHASFRSSWNAVKLLRLQATALKIFQSLSRQMSVFPLAAAA